MRDKAYRARGRPARGPLHPPRPLHRHPPRGDLQCCSDAAIGRGHVDLERGVFYRRAEGARETKKRQPPVRLPDRLLAHLRRWERLGIAKQAVVEWNGKPVRSVRKAFAAAVQAAGLDKHGSHRTFCAIRRRPGRCRTAPIYGRPRASSG